MTVRFQVIYKNFRYEIAQTNTGDFYLVDMGLPVIAWFIYLYGYFFPRRCYPISKKTAKLLLDQKKTSTGSAALAVGLGALLTIIIRQTNDILSVRLGVGVKIVVMLLIMTLLTLVRFYYMQKARNGALDAGAIMKPEACKLIRFTPAEWKLTALVLGIMLMMMGGLVVFVFMILAPSVNIISFLLFAIIFFSTIIISSMILPLNWEFSMHDYK